MDLVPQLTLVSGTMFSGKSSFLMKEISRHEIVGRDVLAVKPSRDTRTKELLSSHDGTEKHRVISIHTMAEIFQMEGWERFHVIAVEEGQFFEDISDIVPILLQHRKIVIVATLNCDYLGNPFTNTLPLYAQAEVVHRLSAICMECKLDGAIFAHRKSNSTDLILIGGIDAYTPMCRSCFFKNNPPK